MSETVQGEVVTLNINQIKPYWRNPRINEQAVAAVAESIRAYGYNQFIVVDAKNVIVVGHTRFKALNRLGLTDIKCIVADLPAQKAKQYRIADNKTSELAAWDDALLIQELRETELPEMEIFFPEVALDELVKESTGTIRWDEVTEETFENAVLSEAGKIEALAEKRRSEETLVMCPHCGEEFTVI